MLFEFYPSSSFTLPMSCFSFGPKKGENVGEQPEVTWSGEEQNTKPGPRDTEAGRVQGASEKFGSVHLCAFEIPGDNLQSYW